MVVAILVDTLRADHLRPELAPRLWSWFGSGRRFTDLIAPASWTLPSVASLFTARPVLDLTTPDGELIGVPRGLATWPQAFDDAGFLAGAVVANYTVHVRNGFAEGFSSYQVPDGHGGPKPDAAWVVDAARSWLAARDGEEVLLYLHLMEPHEPYRDHLGTRRPAPDLGPLVHRRRPATADETALLRDLYAGEVAHLDRALAPLLDLLPADALVALTSDHGESLGEHDCWGHGLSLYQSELAVPLLLRGPGVPTGVEPRPLRLEDLGPTLLALAGVEPAEPLPGRSLLAGGSDQPLAAATFGAGPLRWAFRRGADKVVLHLAPQPGLVTPRATAMEEERPLPTGAFAFDLAADPGEEHPRPLEGELLAATGAAFAATVGRMVPGLQLLAWGASGPQRLEALLDGHLDPVQAWSTGAVAVEQGAGSVRLSCGESFPVCALAGSLAGASRIAAGESTLPWSDGDGLVQGSPPPLAVGRAALWLNPPRERLVDGYEETLDRLRALGYLQ